MNPANAGTAPVTIPKIAAIIIVHNQATELRRAIVALERSEQREQLEILVVDCASDDSTAEVADEFRGITMQRLPENFSATQGAEHRDANGPGGVPVSALAGRGSCAGYRCAPG